VQISAVLAKSASATTTMTMRQTAEVGQGLSQIAMLPSSGHQLHWSRRRTQATVMSRAPWGAVIAWAEARSATAAEAQRQAAPASEVPLFYQNPLQRTEALLKGKLWSRRREKFLRTS
jgi:hypothetical protein